MKLQLSAILFSSTLVSIPVLAADNTAAQAPVAVPQAVVETVPAPAKAATEIVKMSNAGLDEAAILAYVATAPPSVLRADDIIYLHEHGISSAVITAMLQNRPKVEVTQAQAAPVQPQQQQAAAYQAHLTPPAYVSAPAYDYGYPYYYDSYYPYSYYPYSSIVLGGSFWFGNPFFHHGFHNGFHSFPTHHSGFHTVSGGSGFHTVSGGASHSGFHTVSGGGGHGGGGFHGGHR